MPWSMCEASGLANRSGEPGAIELTRSVFVLEEIETDEAGDEVGGFGFSWRPDLQVRGGFEQIGQAGGAFDADVDFVITFVVAFAGNDAVGGDHRRGDIHFGEDHVVAVAAGVV